MMPITRRLIGQAAPLTCAAEEFAIKYQNNDGQWVGVHPSLKLTNQPRELDPGQYREGGQLPNVDLSKGGLYSPETLNRMEAFLQQGYLQEAKVARVMGQTKLPTGDPTEIISPKHLFPQLTTATFFTQLWDHTLSFTNTFGHAAAIFVGAWTLYQITVGLCKTIYSIVILRQVPDIPWWSVCCFDCVMARKIARTPSDVTMLHEELRRLEAKVEALRAEDSVYKELYGTQLSQRSRSFRATSPLPRRPIYPTMSRLDLGNSMPPSMPLLP